MASLLMRKLVKIVVITAVLLLQVLVFLFLKQFGSNQFELPVYYEAGNPITGCASIKQPHQPGEEFLSLYDLQGITLVSAKTGTNKFEYDLVNALTKYPEVNLVSLQLDTLDQQTQLRILNCELIMGKDKEVFEPAMNKYVLLDTKHHIRGYFYLDELLEIERLDMELDILLNYEL